MEINSLKVYGCYDFRIEKEALLSFLERFALDAHTQFLIGHFPQSGAPLGGRESGVDALAGAPPAQPLAGLPLFFLDLH